MDYNKILLEICHYHNSYFDNREPNLVNVSLLTLLAPFYQTVT